MKKILLSAVALLTTMTVNAQEVGQILTEDLVSRIGLTTDKNDEGKSIKNDVAAGTVFCETENVTMSAAFDDSYSPENAASPKIDDANYGTIKIGDLTIDATQATQGNSNPKDEAGSNPAAASTVPVGPAAVFQFDVKKDGYLYVFHKATSNKNYMVYENKAPMGYIFTMSTDGTKALPKVFGYELKGEGEYNYLPDGTEVKMPEKILLGDDAEDVKQNGLSVIKFPVFAGCSYWVNATGSKITSCGFYFDETGDATITIENGVSEALILLDKGQIPGAAPAPVEEKVYSVIGTLVGGWDVENDVDMTVVNGVYSATIDNIAAGSYEWKIRQDHAWTINWGDAGDGTGVQDGPNFIAELPEGASITITFNPATAEIHTYVVGGAIAGAVLYEADFTGITEFTGWSQFGDEQTDGKVDVDADGVAITVGIQTGQLWQPQVMIVPDGSFNLEEDGNYKVIITAKYPADGTLQVNMGSWSANDQAQFPITATGDFQTDEFVFEGWSVTAEGAHLLFQCGDFKGTTIVKSVQIIDLDATAIKSVKTAKMADGAIYNLAGQKVNASYKGVVIKEGKKFIQK